MQVQRYIKPSKNEIKELDNSYNNKKNGNIFFKGFMTLELTTNVQFMLHHWLFSSLETALDTDDPSLV